MFQKYGFPEDWSNSEAKPPCRLNQNRSTEMRWNEMKRPKNYKKWIANLQVCMEFFSCQLFTTFCNTTQIRFQRCWFRFLEQDPRREGNAKFWWNRGWFFRDCHIIRTLGNAQPKWSKNKTIAWIRQPIPFRLRFVCLQTDAISNVEKLIICSLICSTTLFTYEH